MPVFTGLRFGFGKGPSGPAGPVKPGAPAGPVGPGAPGSGILLQTNPSHLQRELL